ncbi:hypothetical protein Hdeb2414_s0047g00748941 [Helianthus debilis subsp. tardiflorus]
MEVQVLPPSPPTDFHFDSTSTSPYATAPSSPQSSIPFTWEEKPGIPKNVQDHTEDYQQTDTEFAFGYLERHSISAADELFDCGKIKPLKPPPRLHVSNDSPKSPKSPKQRFKEALSPRSNKNKEFDPFSEALKQACWENQAEANHQHHRGRGRTMKTARHKVSRSLSPFKIGDVVNNGRESKEEQSLTWYNKWNLKNLLLFRSASEGSATRKANLRYKSGLMGCLRFNQNAAGSVHHEISRGFGSVIKR